MHNQSASTGNIIATKAPTLSKQVLYITYDGLTDPLGQSQILPYLQGLSPQGYQFTVLSFEKKGRFQKNKKNIEALCAASGIRWVPLSFTTWPPLLAKFYDAIRMKNKAVALHKLIGFSMVHCRSYIAADVGLYLKQKFGLKFLFDMRGFWADEKKDAGHWNIKHPLFKRVYQYYKKKEKAYLQNADYIISLTEAGKKELSTWSSYNRKVPVQVIPCCADMQLFSVTDENQKNESRRKLGIQRSQIVFSYLGGVGLWYMLDEMLKFFKQVKHAYPKAIFLFVTHSDPSLIRKSITKMELEENDFIILEASRKDVPFIMKASDINISFIKPVYSKISSSPTKLGEVLSMGIPVICNAGVGDVEYIVTTTKSGLVLNNFSDFDIKKAIDEIPALLNKNPLQIRDNAKHIYSLKRGIDLYAECYNTLLNKR